MSDLETPKAFPLITPIRVGETEVAEVTLREPTAGDIEQLQKDTERFGAAGALILLMSRQSKLAPVDVRKIGARDFNQLQEYIGSFLETAPPTSEN